MNTLQPKKTREKNPKNWDIHYSTYYWQIYLNRSHPLNNPNVECLTGYSKKEKQNEAQDIHHVLKAKILNLNTHGYFERMQRMVIYMRSGEIINKRTDPDILILYPNNYVIPPQNHEYIFKIFASFLNEFYLRKREHKSLEGLLPKLKTRHSKDDFLNVQKQHFTSVHQLYTYAGKLMLYGHSEAECNHFIMKYKELKNWNG